MFKDKNLKAYDKDYYNRQTHMRNDYSVLADWIQANIKGRVFGDVGCGEGYLIADLSEKYKKEVWGVDGSPAFQEFINDHIKKAIKNLDLTKRQKLSKADVAISMEVGEHLPEKSADIFVGNIVSSQADVIVFSAAPPGQDGTNHINLQPPEYWIEKFETNGYTLNKALTAKFKKDLKPRLKYAWWYVNNISILEKKSSKAG